MKYINEKNVLQYQASCQTFYEDHKQDLVSKPAPCQNRQCTDIWFMLIFVLLFIAFGVYSSYSIHLIMQLGFTELDQSDNVTFLKQVNQKQFERLGKVVASCISGSVAISIVVLICLKYCPETTIGFISFITILTIAAAGLIDTQQQTGMSAYFIALALSYAGFVFKFWDNLRKAAVLMQTVGDFIAQNLKILLILLFALLYCTVILFMWVGGFYSFCVRYSHSHLSFEGFIVSFVFWVVMLIFFNFYFYYTSVFLTANAISVWFFGKTEQFGIITSPYRFMIRYHLGTITFASMAITFGKFIHFLILLAKLKQTQNPALNLVGSFVYWTISCCLGAIEAIVEVLNNYSIIICSLTGHNLMNSAKIVGKLFLNDKTGVFNDFTYTTYIVNIGAVLTVSIVPTLMGAVLLKNINGPLWALSVLMIYFTSSMIGLLMLQIFVESASTLFLLYTLDGKLSEEGLDVVWVEKFAADLQKGFDKAFAGKLEKQNIKTTKIKDLFIKRIDQAKNKILQKKKNPNSNKDLQSSDLINFLSDMENDCMDIAEVFLEDDKGQTNKLLKYFITGVGKFDELLKRKDQFLADLEKRLDKAVTGKPLDENEKASKIVEFLTNEKEKIKKIVEQSDKYVADLEKMLDIAVIGKTLDENGKANKIAEFIINEKEKIKKIVEQSDKCVADLEKKHNKAVIGNFLDENGKANKIEKFITNKKKKVKKIIEQSNEWAADLEKKSDKAVSGKPLDDNGKAQKIKKIHFLSHKYLDLLHADQDL